MSISFKLFWPVAYNAGETDTGSIQNVFPLIFSEGQLGRKFILFLYLSIDHVRIGKTILSKDKFKTNSSDEHTE